MEKPSGTIDSISDTALWVAVYRAMETDRPDALFRDPYARMLAGKRGEEIVRTIPRGKASAWAMIVRTEVLDEMVLQLIREEGIETVVNLAAGLDMRPYRLPLPSSLQWVEVDLPAMIDYKESKISDEKPICRLERIRADLADKAARSELLTRLDSHAGKTIVITEGLLVYLPAEQVADLARDLANCKRIRYWLADVSSPPLLKYAQKSWSKSLQKSGARMQFAPEEGAEFFAPFGWKCKETRSFMAEAQRLKRTMPLWGLVKLITRFYPRKTREQFHRAGVILLQRSGSH